MTLLRKLKPFDLKSGHLNVVIDTPKDAEINSRSILGLMLTS